MDNNAIQIAVRVRPFHPEKEIPFVHKPSTQPFFHGDGNFGVSPQKTVASGSLREVVEVIDERELDFDKPPDTGHTVSFGGARRPPSIGRRYKNRKYVFDQIFSMNTNQQEVFEKTAKPLLPGVLDGYNSTVFAYGATGCGKTHTISGTADDPGIIVRTMQELFELVEASKDEFDTYFELSMVEIYNECIRDLLNEDFPNCPVGGLRLLENEKERVTIDKVTLKRPTSADEVMDLVQLGNTRRSTSSTSRNSVSSRSHLVLQINVGRAERGTQVDTDKAIVRQCSSSATLSIIDLAGSEKATVNVGQRMKEGANINKSLLALSSCISALCQRPIRGISAHVPYRNSKLTRLLKFSLGGNCRTTMINCISPSSRDIEETNNTLVWADKAKNVSTKVSRNTAGVELRTAQWIQKIVTLEATITSLNAQLAKVRTDKAGLQKKALDEAKMRSRMDIEKQEAELDGLLPLIVEGAEKEGMWTASSDQVEAFRTRLDDIDVEVGHGRSPEDASTEKNHIRSLIQQQESAYLFNSEIQQAIQGMKLKQITWNNSLKKLEERKFSDNLGEAMYEHQLKVAELKAHVVRSVAAAKERGYRNFAAQQSDSFTKSASLLSRFSSLFLHEIATLSSGSAAESDDIDALIKRLQSLGATVQSSVATLFGDAAHSRPPSSARLPVSLAAPSPRRSGFRPAGSPPKKFSHRVSPKKSLPLRPNLFAAAISNSAAIEPKQNKAFRWADETGEGKIDDRSIAPDCPVFSSPSTGEASMSADGIPADISSDWEDVPAASKPAIPLLPTALRPLPTPAPIVVPVVNSASTSTASAPLPGWKQARIAAGLVSTMDSVDEEGNSSVAPAARPITSGLMGPPIRPNRPGPLAELHTVPSSQISMPASASTSTSSLLKPTAASAAKAAGTGGGSFGLGSMKAAVSSIASGSGGGAMLPPSKPMSRRESTLGPARHDRPRPRFSALPSSHGGHDMSISGLPGGGLSTLSGGAKSFEGGGPLRAGPRMSVSGHTAGPYAHGPRSGGGAGGDRRTSLAMGMSGLPRGPTLSSRPSMSRLNESVSAGDTSIRPAWR